MDIQMPSEDTENVESVPLERHQEKIKELEDAHKAHIGKLEHHYWGIEEHLSTRLATIQGEKEAIQKAKNARDDDLEVQIGTIGDREKEIKTLKEDKDAVNGTLGMLNKRIQELEDAHKQDMKEKFECQRTLEATTVALEAKKKRLRVSLGPHASMMDDDASSSVPDDGARMQSLEVGEHYAPLGGLHDQIGRLEMQIFELEKENQELKDGAVIKRNNEANTQQMDDPDWEEKCRMALTKCHYLLVSAGVDGNNLFKKEPVLKDLGWKFGIIRPDNAPSHFKNTKKNAKRRQRRAEFRQNAGAAGSETHSQSPNLKDELGSLNGSDAIDGSEDDANDIPVANKPPKAATGGPFNPFKPYKSVSAETQTDLTGEFVNWTTAADTSSMETQTDFSGDIVKRVKTQIDKSMQTEVLYPTAPASSSMETQTDISGDVVKQTTAPASNSMETQTDISGDVVKQTIAPASSSMETQTDISGDIVKRTIAPASISIETQTDLSGNFVKCPDPKNHQRVLTAVPYFKPRHTTGLSTGTQTDLSGDLVRRPNPKIDKGVQTAVPYPTAPATSSMETQTDVSGDVVKRSDSKVNKSVQTEALNRVFVKPPDQFVSKGVQTAAAVQPDPPAGSNERKRPTSQRRPVGWKVFLFFGLMMALALTIMALMANKQSDWQYANDTLNRQPIFLIEKESWASRLGRSLGDRFITVADWEASVEDRYRRYSPAEY